MNDHAARCGPGRRCAPSASPFARRPKSCGPSKSGLLFRMADRPTKVPRRRRRQVSTVAGESTKQADKTTACGTPDVSGAFVVTNSCAFYTLRMRLRTHAHGPPKCERFGDKAMRKFRRSATGRKTGAHFCWSRSASGVPRTLSQARAKRFPQTSGAPRREIAKPYPLSAPRAV